MKKDTMGKYSLQNANKELSESDTRAHSDAARWILYYTNSAHFNH